MKDDVNHSHHHDHGVVTAGNPAKPFMDPVCGMEVGPNPDKQISHARQYYHFCSTRFMDKFQAKSQQYL